MTPISLLYNGNSTLIALLYNGHFTVMQGLFVSYFVLKAFIAPEVMTGDNKVECEKCCTKTETTMTQVGRVRASGESALELGIGFTKGFGYSENHIGVKWSKTDPKT